MTVNMLLPPLGEIKEWRMKAGMSQKALAKAIGISASAMNKIEKGRLKPSYETVAAIFKALSEHSSAEARGKTLADIMTEDILMATEDWTLERAIEEMDLNHFGQIPVRVGSKIVGTVTERSLSRFFSKNEGRRSASVTEAMEAPLPQVPGDTSLSAVEALLYEYPGLLVNDGKGVVGIVTRADVYKR